jgi:hypothetical protein
MKLCHADLADTRWTLLPKVEVLNMSNYKPEASSLVTLTFGAALSAFALLSNGCGPTHNAAAHQGETQSAVAATPQTAEPHAPVLYAVFDDKSRSVKTARVAPLQEQDLLALIDVLRQTGGELSFGLLGESRDRPLVRLRIPAPPARPVERTVQNPFERADEDAKFQAALAQYEPLRQRWETETSERINAFLSAVRPRLQEPAHDNVTDVYAALGRAELFLNEPAVVWLRATHRYIILNGDGIDTAGRKPVEIKSGARLLLINGGGSVGQLAPLNPLRFESKQAAFDFIAATELGRHER